MPDAFRLVTAKATIYLPGGTHGFRPGSTLPLSEEAFKDLTGAGHAEPKAPAENAEPAAPVPAPDAPAA